MESPGQAVQYSPIFGYEKVTLQGTSGGSGDNFVGPGFVEEEEFRGTLVAGTPALNSLTASGADWAVNQFDTHASANSHYVEVVASSNPNVVGLHTDIVSHTAATLTTAENLSAQLTGGETISIRRHRTISSTFGAANESGLAQGTPTVSDAISTMSAGTNPSFSSYYHRFGAGLGGDGWRSTSNPFNDESNRPLRLGEGLLIQRRQASSLEIVLQGYVHEGTLRIPLKTGYNLIDPVAPITDQTGGGANFTLGGTASSTVIPSGLQGTLSQGEATVADIVNVFDGLQAFNSFYLRGTGLIGGPGWRKTTNPFENAESTVIPPLSSLLFQIKSTGGTWTRPQPFTLP